ncbi:hypothetical protein SAMN05216227_102049 [Pseudorhodobacter antarcticus]|uniref:Uncharacterized protein n=1 Tax=Pseudorhodobacter antarcticus TaxID=1077947 RepID=A0A1H8IIT2_9RHOB|nr:hypothetical protein [Pseudorhodobacter antarcticus]SEN68106.1 hypothetical protein SAMN05216227_102049 [Pseudorhodobacter antarcticus]
MALFTALAIGALAVGVGSAVMASKDRKKQRTQLAATQEKQETGATEAARLKRMKEDTGARVKIGSVDDPDTTNGATKKGAGKRTSSGGVVGGVSASAIGGL